MTKFKSLEMVRDHAVATLVKAEKPQHFYVYYHSKDGHVIYERTCGTQRGAEERVVELGKRGLVAFWQDTVHPGAFV